MYRRLIADFLALCEQQNTEITPDGLAAAISKANESFLQVLKVDVPYYDRLFTEWDAKRIGQQEFQEVFLGRDGVYAYIGRRAQILARHRRLRLSGVEPMGQQLDLPTYLVYMRGFRDGTERTAKSVYLSQHLNPQAAHYYDTGYTGTLPEDIMRVLGIPAAEMDKKIRLLSAVKRNHTVLGLKGNHSERDQIVNTIEYNAKDEDSAEGLYQTADSDELQPYAAPTSPAERLQFRLIQMALHRHYYTQELSGSDERRFETIRLDQREIRLSDDLDEPDRQKLTEIFSSSDVGARLTSNGVKVKVANPNDPYPDEMVLILPLPSREVVVKNIVQAKMQGVIDEFEALLILDKIGIRVPRPLMRSFDRDGGGMLVMERLDGISGRAIKQYFDEQGFSEDQRQALLAEAKVKMTDIAETVRRDVGMDKPWRLKDFMFTIKFDDTGSPHFDSFIPIDFERVTVFDPDNPESLRLGQGLDD
jgi:hypothetical protein